MRGAWAWLAWVATLMLVAQPAMAAAMGGHAPGETIVVELCSAHSPGKLVKVELPGEPAPKAECEKCVHCSAPPAAIEAQAPLDAVTPTAYFAVGPRAEAVEPLSLGRAPPRPPSQGPPLPNA